MLISMGSAILLERIAYRPLRFAPRLVPLITAIGASFFLQYFFRGLYGANIKVYPEIAALKGNLQIGTYSIQYIQVLVIVAASVMMGRTAPLRAENAHRQSDARRFGRQADRGADGD